MFQVNYFGGRNVISLFFIHMIKLIFMGVRNMRWRYERLVFVDEFMIRSSGRL